MALQLDQVAIGDKFYILGGNDLNQVFVASINDLLQYAVPAAANQITLIATSSCDAKSAWKKLCESERVTYAVALSMLDGKLLAMVEETNSILPYLEGTKVYMYSPSANSWLYISDLPLLLTGARFAALSSTEILVIDGWTDR